MLPVAAGTKVAFAGNIGAYMSYDDVPADGIIGEVVTVRSATGEITHHDGKVFVKWADGKFRPIHAEHLRLVTSGKTAMEHASEDALKKWFKDHPNMTKEQKSKHTVSKGEGKKEPDAQLKTNLDNAVKRLKEWEADDYKQYMAKVDKAESMEEKIRLLEEAGDEVDGHLEGYNSQDDRDGLRRVNLALMMTSQWLEELGSKGEGKQASDIKAQFEKIKALAEKRPDSDFLKSILKQMADKGFAPTDKQMAVVKKIEGEIKQQGEMKKELKGLDKKGDFNADDIGKKQNGPLTADPEDKKIMDHFGQGDLHEMTEVASDKTATFRVASLGDLTDFLKVASGALVHKSTKDLWSYSKDADGNFLVSRLFDDEGEPLKV